MVRVRFEICFQRSYERTGCGRWKRKPERVKVLGLIKWSLRDEFQSGYVTFKMSVRITKRNFQTGGRTNEPGVQERDQGWK